MALSGTQEGLTLMNATASAWETSEMPVNGSDVTPEFSMEEVIMSSLMAILAPAGLVGNVVVLWLLGFRMKRNTFSTYILNLAGADFLFLCCQITYSLKRLVYYWHSIFISIPDFVTTLLTIAYIAGLSFLTAVSTERCLSVLWPIWYRCCRPRHTSAVMCALLWALSLLLSILEGDNCGFLARNFNRVWCQVLDLITTAWLIFLFVILLVSSLALLTRLLCGFQRVPLTRLYVTLVFTVLAFLLCGLPFGINWFLLFWTESDFNIFSQFYPFSHVLSCVNSCANPIIYFFVGSFRQRLRQRRTLRLVLQRALQDFPEEDEHGGRLPQETQEMSGSSLVS